MTTSSAPEQVAGPACLAWFGNKEDGVCLGYSNGSGYTVGTPQFNYCPPGNANRDGCGLSTGPLLPGTTFEAVSALPSARYRSSPVGSTSGLSTAVVVVDRRQRDHRRIG